MGLYNYMHHFIRLISSCGRCMFLLLLIKFHMVCIIIHVKLYILFEIKSFLLASTVIIVWLLNINFHIETEKTTELKMVNSCCIGMLHIINKNVFHIPHVRRLEINIIILQLIMSEDVLHKLYCKQKKDATYQWKQGQLLKYMKKTFIVICVFVL